MCFGVINPLVEAQRKFLFTHKSFKFLIMKKVTMFLSAMLLLAAIVTSCNKNANTLDVDAPFVGEDNSSLISPMKEEIETFSFETEGEDVTSQFDTEVIKQLIIEQLYSDPYEKFRDSDLQSLINADQIFVYANSEGFVTVTEWIGKDGVDNGYASRLVVADGGLSYTLEAEGGCTSRGCSCTLKLCSCLSTTGSCTRPWSPPTN